MSEYDIRPPTGNKEWKSIFRVGMFKVAMTYSQKKGIRTEWDPYIPSSMSSWDLNEYRSGRDALLAEIGKELGGSVLVIET